MTLTSYADNDDNEEYVCLTPRNNDRLLYKIWNYMLNAIPKRSIALLDLEKNSL